MQVFFLVGEKNLPEMERHSKNNLQIQLEHVFFSKLKNQTKTEKSASYKCHTIQGISHLGKKEKHLQKCLGKGLS